MKISRLFEIVYLLLNKKSITANALARHFEVSKRTILRDIDTLSAAGVPVYTTQGKGGGISILDSFVLNKATISDEEQNQILFALQGLTATQNIQTEKLLERLQNLFEKTDHNWIEVDFSRWGVSSTDNERFEQLKHAIINKFAITFTYSNTHGETIVRKVYPLKLVFKSKSWYLQGFCTAKEDYRTFKINRMRDIEKIEEKFDKLDLKVPPLESDGHPSCKIDIKLLIPVHFAYRVYDDFHAHHIVKNEDGSFIVTAKVPDGDWLYRYLLSFGDAITILEPQSVIDYVVEQAEKLKIKYLL